MASLIESASVLFAERGPASVSVRDLAEHAQVNHGLVFRHFGSKEGLLKAVMSREAEGFAAATEFSSDPRASIHDLFEENVRRERFIRILAFSLLSGTPTEDLYSERGALGQLLARLEHEPDVQRPAPPVGIDARVAVAAVSAFMKGWLLFEPWVLTAVGAQDDDLSRIRADVATLLEQVILSVSPDKGKSAATRAGARPRTAVRKRASSRSSAPTS